MGGEVPIPLLFFLFGIMAGKKGFDFELVERLLDDRSRGFGSVAAPPVVRTNVKANLVNAL
jgi:hypothetical protein